MPLTQIASKRFDWERCEGRHGELCVVGTAHPTGSEAKRATLDPERREIERYKERRRNREDKDRQRGQLGESE